MSDRWDGGWNGGMMSQNEVLAMREAHAEIERAYRERAAWDAVEERDATIASLRHAGSMAAEVYGASLARQSEKADALSAALHALAAASREAEASAFLRAAEAMRETAAKTAEREGTWDIAAAIRALPLPAYVPSQPEQGNESDDPQAVADAAARARMAAAQRMIGTEGER